MQEIFDSAELLANLDRNAVKVEHSVYDYVVYDSSTVEKPFALALDRDLDVKMFFKIPERFKIETPISTYNPDWAVYFARNGEEKLYFILEAKGTMNLFDLRTPEQLKIHCGRKHFEVLDDVKMWPEPVTEWSEFKKKYNSNSIQNLRWRFTLTQICVKIMLEVIEMPRTIPFRETMTVEFKSDIKKYSDSDLFEDVVAFANTGGGDLYLGVEDDGTITGVHKDHSNPITLSAYIANNTVPPISARTEIIEEEHPVLKISVPKFYGGIAATRSGKMLRRRMKSDNTPENVPMYPTEIATRLSDLRLLDYSAMIVFDGSPEDIDPLEIERLRTIILSYDGDKAILELSDGELLKALGFTREQNGVVYPTVAGLLMVGRVFSIKRFVPTAAASFQVLEGTRVRINEDYVLPVLACIEKIISHMEAWNPECEIEMGLFRMPAPEFDKRAFREAVVNAFSHRDYSLMGRVRIAVTEDGLTIANPGGLIEGVTVRNLLTAEPHGRNQLLADALKRVGLAEKTGRGIDRIFEGSLIYGRGFPDYSNTTSAVVSLFIPRSKPDAQLAKMIAEEHNRLGRPLPINTLLVLNMLRDSPRSDVKQLSEALNLSEAMIKTILDRAIETGLVEGYGAGRGRNYSLSHELYQDKDKTAGYVRQRDIDETRHQELIISMARSSEYISRADVVNLLHVKESKAYGLLKALVDQGALAPVNKGRYAKYRLIR